MTPPPEVRPDSTERAIIGALDELSKGATHKWGDRAWTKAVKSRLAALGKAKGHLVYASDCRGADGGERLYDLIWLKYKGPILTSVPLVVESEWTPGAVDDDFQKLVVARAEHRLMILNTRRRNSQREVIRGLLRHASKLTSAMRGDRYLFAAWNHRTDGFDYSAHCVA